MSMDSHVRRGHPITFGLIILFAIIELAISAWLVSRFNAHHNYLSISIRDKTRYILFCSIWTVFFSFFYMVLFLHSASTGSVLTSVASHGIFLIITWIFWLAAAASITAALNGGLNCSHHIVYCGQQNAMEGFAWVLWILFTFALVIVMIRGISASRRGDGMRGQLVSA